MKYGFIKPGFLLLTAFGLAACGGSGNGVGGEPIDAEPIDNSPTEPTGYQVTSQVQGSGALAPGEQTVAAGEVATFAVLPGSGQVVESVTGCGGSLEGQSYTTAPITSSCTVTAVFAAQRQQFTVSTEVGEGGQLAPLGQTVSAGETATFSIEPDPGYRLDAVSGCGGSLEDSHYVTGPVMGDCTVKASFALEQSSHPVVGIVMGLEGELVLALDVGANEEALVVSGDGSQSLTFAFSTLVDVGQSYEVAVAEQPLGQQCEVRNGVGVVPAEGGSDVEVVCSRIEATATVSGTITPAANIDVDSDLNDILAAYRDNSMLSLAQPVNNRATVHGFAAAVPTGGSPQSERFASEPDPDDFYQVTLQAGQVIRLQVVNYEGYANNVEYQGDLDVYLLDEQGGLVDVSQRTTEFEDITVPTSGNYVVQVYAYSGISKYVLRFTPPEAGETMSTSRSEFVPGEMVIKLQETASNQSMSKSLAGLRLKQGGHGRASLAAIDDAAVSVQGQSKVKAVVPNRAMEELHARAPKAHHKIKTLRKIKETRAKPGVLYAEPNYIRQAFRTPDDPGYRYQWHYRSINLPQAWDITTGETGSTEDPVIVAVIDTGVVLDHPDLNAQLVPGYDFIRDAERARDLDGIDPDPDDPGDAEIVGQSSWHGSHVAGTVAAASNSRGVVGVSWGARIMPIRVIGMGGATSYDVVQGLRFAAGLPNDSGIVPEQPADIANLSLGGPQASLAEQEAYQEARAAGLMIIAAAGNENSSTRSYPAAYEGVVSVAATDILQQRAPYSNYGNTIDLAAPGGNMAADFNGDGYPDGVLSTVVDDTSGNREPIYSFYQGTSMAAPHVSGVVALMKAVYPALTPAELDRIIVSGAVTQDLGAQGRDDLYGYGLIDAQRAVQVATDLAGGADVPEQPPQIAVTPAMINLGLGDSAQVTVSNEGGGNPTITAVTNDADWLSVTPEDVHSSGLGSYLLQVDRTGLPDGLYQSEVIFTVDNGDTISVQVAIQVGETPAESQLTQMYVLLIDAETLTVVNEVLAENVPQSNIKRFAFADVPVGQYYVTAGSDVDVDFVICQSGEVCGAYPTLDNRQPIRVEGTDMSDLDFVANILGGFATTSSAPEPAEQSETAESGFNRVDSPAAQLRRSGTGE